MSYSDFTLDDLIERFGLQTDEQGDYFAPIAPVAISEHLKEHLREFVPRAIAIGTEKGRSELIIVPVLVEVIRQSPKPVSFFSGVEFSPDPDHGLRGVCDYQV